MCILWVCMLASERLVDLQMARSAQPRNIRSSFRLFLLRHIGRKQEANSIKTPKQTSTRKRGSKHSSGHASLCFCNSLRPGVSVPPTRAAHLRHHEGVRRHLRPLLLLSNTLVLSFVAFLQCCI